MTPPASTNTLWGEMRTKLFFPLIVATLFGCDGRYDLGNQQTQIDNSSGSGGSAGRGGSSPVNQGGSAGASVGGAAAGTAGSDVGGAPGTAGSSGNAGTSGNASTGGNGGTSGNAGSSGSGGSGGGTITGTRSWLAVMSFVSTTSSETGLRFVDLNDPASTPQVVADDLIVVDPSLGDGFSPDGRWYVYRIYKTPNYEVNIVHVGDELGTPQVLGTTSTTGPCRWAPDSSNIVCATVPTGNHDPRDANIQVSYTSGDGMVQTYPYAVGKPEFVFLGSESLVYAAPYEEGTHHFISTNYNLPLLVNVGTADGLIVQQSPDLLRGFVKGIDTDSPGSFLINFVNGNMGVVDGKIAFSLAPSFATGFGVKPNATDATATDYVYYAIDGVSLNQVGTDTAAQSPHGTNPSSQLFDHTLVHMNGDHVEVVNIGTTGVTATSVPGDLADVNAFALAPNEQWIYAGSWQFGDGGAVDSSGKLWLSHIGADGPETAQLVDSGFIGSTAIFSPDSRFLVVHGYAPQSSAPVPFRLFDLQSSPPKKYTLDTPTNWAYASWSPDSTHLSFIGGDPTTSMRPLYVVDARNPTAAPRLIITCGPGTATTPICPISAYFQP